MKEKGLDFLYFIDFLLFIKTRRTVFVLFVFDQQPLGAAIAAQKCIVDDGIILNLYNSEITAKCSQGTACEQQEAKKAAPDE